jgi:hypothetical protein
LAPQIDRHHCRHGCAVGFRNELHSSQSTHSLLQLPRSYPICTPTIWASVFACRRRDRI